MKFRIAFASIVVLISTAIAADKSSGLPPLIDRDLIFGNPEIAAAELSPNGKYLAFLKPWKDTRNVYVKAVEEPFESARLLTTETKRPVAGYFWTRDSKYILYAKDNDGDENFNVYAVDPSAKPAAGADAPPSRDLTGLKGIYNFTLDWQQDDNVPGPSLFTAVQEQLGLKLAAKKVPIEVFVVDHAEKIPTAN